MNKINSSRSTQHDAGSVASRLAKYTAAAGLGSFAFGQTADATITVVEAPLFLQLSLVGDPAGYAPIESMDYPGYFPFLSIGWADAGFAVQYGDLVTTTYAFGIDLDLNGSADVNFFRGAGYGGYILAEDTNVGFYGGGQPSSGQVQFLSNSTDNPDADGIPGAPGGGGKPALQGFNFGEIIGDGNDAILVEAEGTLREAGYPGDWDGVSDNYGNLYGSGGPTPISSYVGFQISGLATGTGSGFGWIEVILREDPSFVVPELQIIRWAFTDDGSAIAAGDTGAIAGDLDGNGFVDILDLNIVLANWNSDGSADPRADTDGNGLIDILDLNVVLTDWNMGTPPSGTGAATPEPTTLMMLAVGAGSVALRRRSRTA